MDLDPKSDDLKTFLSIQFANPIYLEKSLDFEPSDYMVSAKLVQENEQMAIVPILLMTRKRGKFGSCENRYFLQFGYKDCGMIMLTTKISRPHKFSNCS